jgi:hypothetical protein
LPGANAIGWKLSNARRLFIGPLNPVGNYISQFHELLVGQFSAYEEVAELS